MSQTIKASVWVSFLREQRGTDGFDQTIKASVWVGFFWEQGEIDTVAQTTKAKSPFNRNVPFDVTVINLPSQSDGRESVCVCVYVCVWRGLGVGDELCVGLARRSFVIWRRLKSDRTIYYYLSVTVAETLAGVPLSSRLFRKAFSV